MPFYTTTLLRVSKKKKKKKKKKGAWIDKTQYELFFFKLRFVGFSRSKKVLKIIRQKKNISPFPILSFLILFPLPKFSLFLSLFLILHFFIITCLLLELPFRQIISLLLSSRLLQLSRKILPATKDCFPHQ